MKITGHTRTYALIGDPIAHAKTPELYNRKFAERGIDVVVVPVHVSPESIGDFATAARSWENLVGIGVTIPHKEGMIEQVDRLTDAARLCGATNVIRRAGDGALTGTQMDGPGFVWSLRDNGVSAEGAKVLVQGAGGTARAIAFELAASGAASVTIANRTAERAESLAESIRSAYPDCMAEADRMPAGQFDLIVNATSVGMKESDPLPLDADLLTAGTVVADVIMSPPETALLAEARTRGCVTHSGLRMLEAQFEATVAFLGLDKEEIV
ncbi:shikimate dehydrogenase family protein [Paramicrobacterium chengjingii]|uniref:shikimate dehydrogenase (NADP(+)) n=1 Tax=Paramicrobacterium chengjingii TaxID=2769067 RepID=A0ABX6YHH3_9MICO|nr:shikimate dehydrogenase [Microbacterium chengjingii]QPZ38242.1 shikimate dehydrogenase [Microbacterium chengjingii]